MLFTIKLKHQIVASDCCTCQKGHGIILAENKFALCKIYYTHTKAYVHNQIWYDHYTSVTYIHTYLPTLHAQ